MKKQDTVEELEKKIQGLEKTLASKEKICQVLMNRVERSVDSAGGAYSIFERNILLQDVIDQRSEELQTANEKLSKEVAERINSERRLQSIIQGTPVPTFVIDKNHKVLYWNRALEELTGLKSQAVVGTDEHWKAFYENKTFCAADLLIQKLLGNKSGIDLAKYSKSLIVEGAYEFVDLFPTLGTNGRWLKITAAAIRDSQGAPVGAIQTIEDITERKYAEDKLRELSVTDELTGLNNRRGFFMLANQQLSSAERLGQKLILIYADLDNMKWINDNLGHSEGDKALMEAAHILKSSFRNSDIIARLGGDEFVCLAAETVNDTSKIMIDRLEYNINNLNKQGKRPYRLSISFGIAYYDPEKPFSLEKLLSIGDKMMYEQKQKKPPIDCKNLPVD